MKRNERGISLIILVIAIVLMAVLVSVGVVVIVNKRDTKKENDEEINLAYGEEITDENILYFLKENKIITSYDIYIAYDRDIGNLGPEGDKRYIYKRENGSYYYVEISPLSYTSDGEYLGYNYKANEVFYRIDIQDCDYNEKAEYMDERISDVFGDISYYIVRESKNNLKLMKVIP